MSIFGIVFIWFFFVLAFFILKRWPMGRESDRRHDYWARFEDK